MGQLNIYNKSSSIVNAIFDKLDNKHKELLIKDASDNLNRYVKEIKLAFDALSTPLALHSKDQSDIKTLGEKISTLTVYFSATSILPSLSKNDIEDISKEIAKCIDTIKPILEALCNK